MNGPPGRPPQAAGQAHPRFIERQSLSPTVAAVGLTKGWWQVRRVSGIVAVAVVAAGIAGAATGVADAWVRPEHAVADDTHPGGGFSDPGGGGNDGGGRGDAATPDSGSLRF